ncbi:Calcipressin [Aulographum hederae CBS 113979]|uniref:Calcipressin n=1 Tax=Aulographum hederae CBS 113979 TaxID=1176131 RepID=A0A6G1H787_9PEZI|nr:Calcipressin [Aulographum hederae CBS 113979]
MSPLSKSPARSSPPPPLNFSDLPHLIQPSPPSNTLLITNLQNPLIFSPPTLLSLRNLISSTLPTGLDIHTWAPIRSLKRILLVLPDVTSAIHIRSALDGTTILDCRCRIYFGAETRIYASREEQLLKAPQQEKMFFISPPPSPPMGWEMRNEDPPNKEVHAEDLVLALSRLNAKTLRNAEPIDMTMDNERERTPDLIVDTDMMDVDEEEQHNRQRSGSTGSPTLVYHPQHHGHSPDLPAIQVVDTTGSLVPSPIEKPIFAHTSRPPVELMEH